MGCKSGSLYNCPTSTQETPLKWYVHCLTAVHRCPHTLDNHLLPSLRVHRGGGVHLISRLALL